MEDEDLIKELISQNPWWNTGKVELEKNVVQHSVFPIIEGQLQEKQVLALVGLRSVGKTTLLRQLIQKRLETGTKPSHLFYFSFDGFKKQSEVISKALALYSSSILKLPLAEIDSTVYVFLDEVQKIPDWSEEVKRFYDKNLKLKFIVSGSSSMNILKGSGESLVGRIIINKIYPFSFREFLKYNGLEVKQQNPWNFEYPLSADKISILFNQYLTKGGFPVLYPVKEDARKALLKSMVDLTFYRDIVNVFDIKRSDVLEGLFSIFVRESGNVVNYANLSGALQAKFETIKQYVDYLEASFLISKTRFYSNSVSKTRQKNEKLYVADHAFSMLQETKSGNLVETIVHNALRTTGFELFYWQSDKQREVDIVMTSKSIVPIEVKYQSKIAAEDFKNLLEFMDEFSVKKGVLVTKNLFEVKKQKGKEIHCVPAWLFLLSI
ncbi:MAG: ATP-binding protein [Candidatus Micrarchaeota archaeon]